MSNKATISSEQCLTEEQLLRYAEGAMTRDEERAVDRHIATCDMCSDAVEGAMMISIQDFKKHSAGIGEKIDTAFDKNLNQKPKNQPNNQSNTEGSVTKENSILKPVRSFRLLRWIATAAASVLVLATAGIWLLTKDAPMSQDAKSASTETAIEATPPQYSVDKMDKTPSDTASSSSSDILSDANNSVNVAPVPQTAPQIASKPTTAKPIPSKDNSITDVETDANKDNITSPPTSFGSAPKPSQPIENQAVKEENSKDGVDDLALKREQEFAYKQSDKAAKSKSNADNRMATGNAQSKMAPSAAPMPSTKMVSTDEQLFQTGVNYFNQQDYGNALSNFSKVKQEKVNSDVYEQVQWLSALSQLKQGKKVVAKSILETIVAGKGKYAAQAAEVLKTSF
jgi:anti-sigma factor RsiW